MALGRGSMVICEAMMGFEVGDFDFGFLGL